MLLVIGKVVAQLGMMYLGFLCLRILVRRSGGFRPSNPFQPGWKQLHSQYASAHNVHPTEAISARIGTGTYSGILHLGFDTQELVIKRNLIFSSLVRIPYADIMVLRAPTQIRVTRFSDPEYTPGLLSAGGVEIELPAYWAAQIIKRLPAAPSFLPTTSPS